MLILTFNLLYIFVSICILCWLATLAKTYVHIDLHLNVIS